MSNSVRFIVLYLINDVLHLADIWYARNKTCRLRNYISIWVVLFLYLIESYETALLSRFPKGFANVSEIKKYDAFCDDLEGGLSQAWNICAR